MRKCENVRAEEAVEIEVETKQLKQKILKKILHSKFTKIEDREKL